MADASEKRTDKQSFTYCEEFAVGYPEFNLFVGGLRLRRGDLNGRICVPHRFDRRDPFRSQIRCA